MAISKELEDRAITLFDERTAGQTLTEEQEDELFESIIQELETVAPPEAPTIPEPEITPALPEATAVTPSGIEAARLARIKTKQATETRKERLEILAEKEVTPEERVFPRAQKSLLESIEAGDITAFDLLEGEEAKFVERPVSAGAPGGGLVRLPPEPSKALPKTKKAYNKLVSNTFKDFATIFPRSATSTFFVARDFFIGTPADIEKAPTWSQYMSEINLSGVEGFIEHPLTMISLGSSSVVRPGLAALSKIPGLKNVSKWLTKAYNGKSGDTTADLIMEGQKKARFKPRLPGGRTVSKAGRATKFVGERFVAGALESAPVVAYQGFIDDLEGVDREFVESLLDVYNGGIGNAALGSGLAVLARSFPIPQMLKVLTNLNQIDKEVFIRFASRPSARETFKLTMEEAFPEAAIGKQITTKFTKLLEEESDRAGKAIGAAIKAADETGDAVNIIPLLRNIKKSILQEKSVVPEIEAAKQSLVKSLENLIESTQKKITVKRRVPTEPPLIDPVTGQTITKQVDVDLIKTTFKTTRQELETVKRDFRTRLEFIKDQDLSTSLKVNVQDPQFKQAAGIIQEFVENNMPDPDLFRQLKSTGQLSFSNLEKAKTTMMEFLGKNKNLRSQKANKLVLKLFKGGDMKNLNIDELAEFAKVEKTVESIIREKWGRKIAAGEISRVRGNAKMFNEIDDNRILDKAFDIGLSRVIVENMGKGNVFLTRAILGQLINAGLVVSEKAIAFFDHPIVVRTATSALGREWKIGEKIGPELVSKIRETVGAIQALPGKAKAKTRKEIIELIRTGGELAEEAKEP